MSLTHHIKQMKLFTAIASAAVICASFLVPNPVEASVFIDINNNLEAMFNDGEDIVVIKKDGISRFAHASSFRHPIPSKNEQFFRSLPTFEGTSGVKFKKTNVPEGSSKTTQAGVNSEGKFYMVKDLGGSGDSREAIEAFYNMTQFAQMPKWTIYSLTR